MITIMIFFLEFSRLLSNSQALLIKYYKQHLSIKFKSEMIETLKKYK